MRAGADPFLIDGPDNNPPDDATGAPTGAEDAVEATTPAVDATAPMRAGLRAAAQAVLEAWDDEENQRYGLTEAIDALRAALRRRSRIAGGGAAFGENALL